MTVSNPAMHVPALRDLGLVELAGGSPLRVQLTGDGALFAVRHEATLINQLLPSPGEAGLFRLLLRQSAVERAPACTTLVGPGLPFEALGGAAARWTCVGSDDLHATTTLQLHPSLPAWVWTVELHNTGPCAQMADVLIAHDLGLADEGAVRNNEAYTSQYIDLLPVEDSRLGWVVLARQNQPATGGRHPWLALACADGAAACAIDGWQFFGADHRLTGVPAAARQAVLPSRRLQYECAMPALQSRLCELAPGARVTVRFVACFSADHPEASGAADVERLRDLLAATWCAAPPPDRTDAAAKVAPASPSLFASAPWQHGDRPGAAD